MTHLPVRPRIEPTTDDGDGERPLNIFRTLRHNPGLYKAFLTLGGHLLGSARCRRESAKS